MEQTFTFRGETVTLEVESYRNNNTLAVAIIHEDGNAEIVTTNLCDPLQSDSMAYLDTNNYPDIEQFILENDLGLPMHISTQSGFCRYPLYTIFTDMFNR